MRPRHVVVAAALLTAATVWALADPPDDPGQTKLGEFIPASPPQPAPQLSFTDLAGKPVALADFKGRFVLLNLWATWCQPCLKEMPDLERLQQKLGSGLTILALSEDRAGAAIVEPFVATLGLDQVKVYLDPKSEAIHTVGARGLPTSLVIDRDGMVLGRVEGSAEWTAPAMLKVLQSLLPSTAPDEAAKRAAG
jgi:thiol-disulfide isomerase/thioredoxin